MKNDIPTFKETAIVIVALCVTLGFMGADQQADEEKSAAALVDAKHHAYIEAQISNQTIIAQK